MKIFSVLTVFLISVPAKGQIKESISSYKSEADSLLTISSLAVFTFGDNADGIFARPIEEEVKRTIDNDHRWNLLPSTAVVSSSSVKLLQLDPKVAKTLAQSTEADAFIVGRVVRMAEAVEIQLGLFLKADSKLLLEEKSGEIGRTDIPGLKVEAQNLTKKLIAKIPYDGKVMSRVGERVTLNLGKIDGVKEGQVLSVVQISSMVRHPKFDFLVNTEKVLLGKLLVLKAEDQLSFARITSEKEKGAISIGNKVAGLQFVEYTDDTTQLSAFSAKAQKVSFGENPQPWVPVDPPGFGRVGARLGVGLFDAATQLNNAGSIAASNSAYPHIAIDGEVWITPSWMVTAKLQQAVIKIPNDASSSPKNLNQALGFYEVLAGYNIRMNEHIWGPEVAVLAGWYNYRLFVDDSDPRTFTTFAFSGPKIGVRGALPFGPSQEWRFGAEFYLYLSPKLSETPVQSGDRSSNTINHFGVFGGKRLGERLMITGHLDFMQATVNFSGLGTRGGGESASSASQRHTQLSAGIHYFF